MTGAHLTPSFTPARLKLAHLALLANHHKVRSYTRWGLVHVATVVFACDFIAAIWPGALGAWDGKAHIAVATATVLATVAEYLHDWGEPPREEEDHNPLHHMHF